MNTRETTISEATGADAERLYAIYRSVYDMQKMFFKPFWARKQTSSLDYDELAETAFNNMIAIAELLPKIKENPDLPVIYKELAETLNGGAIFMCSYAQTFCGGALDSEHERKDKRERIFDDLYRQLRRLEKLAKSARKDKLIVAGSN